MYDKLFMFSIGIIIFVFSFAGELYWLTHPDFALKHNLRNVQ